MPRARTASPKIKLAAKPVPARRTSYVWPALLLAVITLLVYISIGSHPFLNYDDEGYVTKNAHVQSGLNLQTVAWAFSSTEMANWHPITWLSHTVDVQMFGNWAGGHHLMSLILHAANAVLLYLLLARGTGSREASLFAAALFALHPINVESVAWVAERKNVLSTFFFLLGIGAYARYAQKPDLSRYLLLVALFVLGLASKPMAVTFPFVLLLCDYWPLRRIAGFTEPAGPFLVPQESMRVLVLEKLPLLALSAASSAITVIAQRATALSTSADLALGTRIENAIFSYAMYVFKAFWPVDLAPIYPHPGNSLPLYQGVLAMLFLVAATAAVWRLRSSRGYLVFGWFWFLGTLVPVIGLIQVGAQAMADRYAYLPFIGLFVMFAESASELAEAKKLQAGFRVFAVLVAGILAAVTFHQLQYWKSPADLWSHTLAVTRNNYIAEDNLASALIRAGDMEALTHFENASRIAPGDPVSHGALAGYYQDQGKFPEAISYYQVAIRNNSDPDMLAVAEANLAIIYRQTGSYEKARETYARAARTSPQALEEMIAGLSQQLAAEPVAEGYLRLGLFLDVANRIPDARAAYEQSLRLDPTLQSARQALASLR